MDEKLAGTREFPSEQSVWTKQGFLEAVKLLLAEKNSLFDSLIGKLNDYPDLKRMVYQLLFQGQTITYNADDPATDMLLMFGFVKVEQKHCRLPTGYLRPVCTITFCPCRRYRTGKCTGWRLE